jgi:hypothetical protein
MSYINYLSLFVVIEIAIVWMILRVLRAFLSRLQADT